MIEVKNISKSFGAIQAVSNISFSLEKGDVLGFLGPNGAGKSTSMKMITGFLNLDSGSIKVSDFDIETQRTNAQEIMGYVPENAPLYEEMYVEEFLYFIAEVRRISIKERAHKVEKVVRMCALINVVGQRIETLSKGYKRRVALASALIHDPKILILDEPTDGLDPNQKHDVRDLIKDLSKEKAILISTHILEEVESICNRCIIISEGVMKYDGTPSEIKSKSSTGSIEDVFRAMTLNENIEGVSLC
ncbi:ABC transporter ATP-binding protein [Bacteriovoracaceae bacterium]|nr:ABC transporter ATP-binding protein [Bacteriovoracaceae bacterium]